MVFVLAPRAPEPTFLFFLHGFGITFSGLTSMSVANWKCQDSRSLMQTRRLGLPIVGVVDSVVESVVDSVVD